MKILVINPGSTSTKAALFEDDRELGRDFNAMNVMIAHIGRGGFVSLLGTNDLREVENLIAGGSEEALLYQQAMAYQLSKHMCSLLPAADGRLDAFVITGGGAHWARLTDDVKARLALLNVPVYIMPGEHKMQALAEGALRVLRGEETAQTYQG